MIYIKLKILKFVDLENEIKKYIKDENLIRKIKECYEFAEEKHRGQKRKSGDNFIQHPLYTAFYLSKWKMGAVSICVGLLHDILEDTPITYNELNEKFGEEISLLVESVTKVSFFAKENRNQIKSLYLRKLYISLAKDIRVIIIKLADRLHNMETIQYHKPLRQKEIAKETLTIYSAIAHRLGMKEAQSKLEDLSFKVINPIEYRRIVNKLKTTKNNLTKVLSNAKRLINKEIFLKINKTFTIYSRTKTIYSIYRKINLFKKNFEDINDILALRVIVDNIDECYNILGLIHQLFIPLSGHFKDYISMPKNNLYQSLHTVVVNSDGYIFEIQIRTHDMDEIAQYGAASHWKYKEGEKYNIEKKQKDIDDRLDIFHRILELENSLLEKKANEGSNLDADFYFENEIKEDIFSSLIYVLTPKGKVITLPYGSTALDFAYKIHSEVGNKTIGAKINGIFCSFGTILSSGDLVEIKTSKNQKPNRNWLKMVKSNSSKERIRKFLKKQNDNKNNLKRISDSEKIKIVKQKIRNYLDKNNLKWKILTNDAILNDKLKELGYMSVDKFLIDVYNKIYSIEDAYKLVYIDNSVDNLEKNLIKNLQEKKKISKKINLTNDVIVTGLDGIKANLSKCCMPIPNEKIVGYVSMAKTIKIHSKDCKNVKNVELDKLLKVSWNVNVTKNKFYLTKIIIFCTDENGMIMKISSILNHLNCPIESISSNKNNTKLLVKIKLTIKIKNSLILEQILSSIRSIKNIREVKRLVN